MEYAYMLNGLRVGAIVALVAVVVQGIDSVDASSHRLPVAVSFGIIAILIGVLGFGKEAEPSVVRNRFMAVVFLMVLSAILWNVLFRWPR